LIHFHIFFLIFIPYKPQKTTPMTKKLIYATLAGAVVQFLLGWLIYGIVLSGFMESQTFHYEGLIKDMNSWRFIVLTFVSGIAMMFMIAYIFQRWAKFDTFMKGLTGGLLLGFLLMFSMDLSFFSMMHLYTKWGMIVDVIVGTIMMGIDGGIIAWVLGYKTKSVEEPKK
ncbi:MAG: hypothetical protein Q8867_07560, partial [Bacteroidota bacterium]|nr:hypothetical protein [Bacteroidota bacterium]